MKKFILIAIFGALSFMTVAHASQGDIVAKKAPTTTVTTAITSKTDATIKELRSEIDRLKVQTEYTEKKLTDVKEDSLTNYDSYQNTTTNSIAFWGLLITALIALGGIFFPILLNNKREKELKEKIEDIKKIVNNTQIKTNEIEDKIKEIKELKEDIDKIKIKIEASEKASEESAKRAKVSQLFSQALEEKDPNKQIELYDEVIKLMPNLAVAYFNRGNTNYSLNRYPYAINDFTNAIKLKKQYYEAYNNRGSVRKDLENYKEAIIDYNKAIELNPKSALAYNNRANTYRELKEFDKALEDVNIALYLDNKNNCYFDTKGEIYFDMRKFEDALDNFSKAIELDSTFKDSYVNRAKTYRKLAEEEKGNATNHEKYLKLATADEEKAKTL